MKTTVVILNYNGEEFLQPLLTRLKHEYVPVVIVDNASKDDSKYLFQRKFADEPMMDWIQLRKNVGFARGNNIGAEYADTEYILFLNNDTLPQAGFIKRMEEGMRPNIGIVGALLIFGEQRDEKITIDGVETTFHASKGKVQHAGIYYTKSETPEPYEYGRELMTHELDIMKPKVVPSVTGACMLVRKNMFRNLGGFSPEFLNGWEDTDLCLRAKEAFNLSCYYQPTAKVIHYVSRAEGRFKHEDQNKAVWKKKWHKNNRLVNLFK